MPETVFDRPTKFDNTAPEKNDMKIDKEEIEYQGEQYVPPAMTLGAYMNRLWFWDLNRPVSRQLKSTDFVVRPLSMLKYPSVAFPALY